MKDTIIQRALRFASKAHEGQKRDFSGDAYITHPIDVVQIIVDEFKIADPEVIASAYLHDVIEDCNVTEEELIAKFNTFIADNVMMVSHTKEQDKIPYYKNYYLADIATCAEIEPAIIKIADRIANTRDFIKAGKTNYAKKYFHKADAIYARIYMEKNYPLIEKAIENMAIRLEEL